MVLFSLGGVKMGEYVLLWGWRDVVVVFAFWIGGMVGQ